MNIHDDRIVFLVASGLVLAAFTWALRAHFRRVGQREPGRLTLLKALFALCAAASGVEIARAPRAIGWTAWSLLAISAGAFLWTLHASRAQRPTLAFSTDTPAFLLMRGPYRFVRHPFYTSYILYFAALMSARPTPTTITSLIVMAGLYALAARGEERKFLRSELRGAYAEYAARVGMFIPRVAGWSRRTRREPCSDSTSQATLSADGARPRSTLVARAR